MRIYIILFSIIFTVGIAGAQNLLINGDFEIWSGGATEPPDNWVELTDDFNATQHSDTIHGGSYSVRLYLTSATSTQKFTQTVGDIASNSDYTFEFWAYDNDPAGRMRVWLTWLDASGSFISSEGPDVYTEDNTNWQQSSYTGTAPTNAESLRVEIRGYDVVANWDGDALFYVDDASLIGGGGDVTPPDIECAFSWGQNSIEVIFNEPLDPTTAENILNYNIDQGISITNAELDASDATLVHLTSSAQSNVFYTLIITNVEDVAGNPMPGDTTYFWGGISTIASAREDLDSDFIPDKKGDIITVEGTATVEWYIISSSACFIQDVTAGINIYTPGFDPGILRGDIARVAGEVAQYTGTTEIKNLARFEVIGQAGVPSPYTVLLSEFGEDNEGSLIRVENVYYAGGDAWPGTGSSANMLITNDTESDTITLRVYYKTDIDGSPEPSWPIDIVGIMDQYDNSVPYDSNYQILPRDVGDLTAVGIEETRCLISLNNIENPIRDNTKVSFTLSKESNISLKVYNMLGQIMTELTIGKYNVGEHAIEWNTENIPTGIYFINLSTGQLRKIQKVVILK